MTQISLNGKPWSQTLAPTEVFILGFEQGFKRISFLPTGGTMTLETTEPTRVIDLDNPGAFLISEPITVPDGQSFTLSINDNEQLDNWTVTAGAGTTVLIYGII